MQNYDKWNKIKKKTATNKLKVGIKPREIWWVKIGHNIGSEEYGKSEIFSRPVIVVRRLTSDLFIGIPTSTTLKDNDYFLPFEYTTKNETIKASAMLLQIRSFSIKRLTSKIGFIDKSKFEELKKRTTKMLFPPKE
jgi:mRNA interferase MazF